MQDALKTYSLAAKYGISAPPELSAVGIFTSYGTIKA